VANQVQTRLVPPSAKAGSTTPAGSRKMSGQLGVEGNTIAAAANATASAPNSAPARRADLSVVTPSARGHRSLLTVCDQRSIFGEARAPVEMGRPS
jgi:hypothetical protein